MIVKLWCYWKRQSWHGPEDKPDLRVWNQDMSSVPDMGVLAGVVEVDLDILPPNHADLVKAQVAEMRREQGELHAKSVEIDRRIAELTAIEYKDGESVSGLCQPGGIGS